MLIGYARISSAGESLEFQRRALDGAEVDRLFVDVASGAKAEHPQREQARALLQKGDTLVVLSLDRLNLNAPDLLKLIEDFDRRRVGFRSLKDDIDTTHKPIPLFVAALSHSERILTLERSAPGRAAARASGRKRGRKPKLDEQQRAQALTLYHDDLPVKNICRKFKIDRSTFFRHLPQGSKRKRGGKPKTKETAAPSTNHPRNIGEEQSNCAGIKRRPASWL